MKLVLRRILPILCLLYAISLKAQQYSVQNFSVSDGLIQSDVNQNIKDSKQLTGYELNKNKTVKISAFDLEGAVTEIPATIYIPIVVPFWQKWWFRTIAFIIVLIILMEFIRRMKKKERKRAENQQQILQLKADALAAQMNPHFVFNCISSINALINIGDKQLASIYLGRFASLLRSVFKSVRLSEISLEEELSINENYMQLEQARYSNPFNYKIERPEGISLTKVMVPPLIIQPFVENSILHGFNRAPNYDKRINILAVISGDRLKVLIEDNGIGITTDNQLETGIKITKERIALLGKNAQVQIETYKDEDHHGTTITIEIPLKIKND